MTYEGVVADKLVAFGMQRSDKQLSRRERRMSQRLAHDQWVRLGRRLTVSVQHVKLRLDFHTLCVSHSKHGLSLASYNLNL